MQQYRRRDQSLIPIKHTHALHWTGEPSGLYIDAAGVFSLP